MSTDFVSMMSRLAYVYGLCALLMTSVACSSLPHLNIYQTESEWVDLREWPSGYPTGSTHSHPVTLESGTIRKVLLKVHYQESTLFSFMMGRAHPVFSEYQLSLLSSKLSLAFEQALPQEIISYQVRNEENGNRHTKGFCFFQNNELHLIIQELDQPDFYSQASEPRPMTIRWKFSPKKGQRLSSAHLERKRENPHWLVIPVIDKRSSHDVRQPSA